MSDPVPSVLLTPEFIKALADASDILRVEANELAEFSAVDMRSMMVRAGADPAKVSVPHRLSIATSSEVSRLRGIATILEGAITKKKEDDE